LIVPWTSLHLTDPKAVLRLKSLQARG